MRTLWPQFRAFLARRIRYKITRGGVAVHLRHLAGGLGRNRLRQQPAFPDCGGDDGHAAGERPGQPPVPGRAGTRFSSPRAHPGRTERAGPPFRAQPQVVPALLFHPRGGHSRARQPDHGIGRLLPADPGRGHAGSRGRRALSRGAAPTGRTASLSPPPFLSASWRRPRASR